MEVVRTLEGFFELNTGLCGLRREIVRDILFTGTPPGHAAERLESVLGQLESMPRGDGRYRLELPKGGWIAIDPDYELGELRKDIAYLRLPRGEFLEFLAGESVPGGKPAFLAELGEGRRRFGTRHFRTFIADRDGTINNYSGRYRSSIQPVYNAVFLSRFAKAFCGTPVILTSAPLAGGGLLDVSVAPPGVFVYAGSKGREYLDRSGRSGVYPLTEAERRMQDRLRTGIKTLVSRPENRVFTLIGSGLQCKEGQTTLARQDIHGTVPMERSNELLERLERFVEELDPDGRYFRIEDTGKDIEIMLTTDPAHRTESGRMFDKGDGVAFLAGELSLGLERGGTLVCGDTPSDIPMARYAATRSPETEVIFVTRDEGLKAEVKKICPEAFFVSGPDVLISILNPEPGD